MIRLLDQATDTKGRYDVHGRRRPPCIVCDALVIELAAGKT